MADYAIHDTTLYDISDVIRKKDGSSALIDPADYAGRINLMGMLEEKTVSGSVVAFSDGADAVKLKSCEVTIAPNLDGISSVDVVQTGKNLFNKNAVEQHTWIIVDSTETETRSAINYLTSDYIPVKANTRYFVSTKASNRAAYYDRNKNGISYFSFSGGGSFLCQYDGYIRLTIKDDTNLNTFVANEGNTAIQYEDFGATHTANLGRTIYGGTADVVNGTGTDENGNDFTFTPVPIITRLGDNTMWSDGDLSVVYRSSGTQTIITPTLISKTVTANGTYSAEDDGADGYDAVVVNVSGGGGNTPEATQTLICDNSSLGSTLTFTDDYENYDLIKFVVYRSDVQNTFVFYATPAMIDACFQYSSNRINFNQPYGNNFVCYQKSSNTSWSRYGVRNMAVQYVYGLTFTNCTVAETELYNRQGIGSSAVTFTPPTGESFLDYDYILLMTCTGNSDETQVNLEVFQPNIEKDIFGSDNVKENTVTVYRYNTGGTIAEVTSNTITSYQYFYVSGLKLNFNQNLLGGSLNSSNSEEENSNNEQEETENETV